MRFSNTGLTENAENGNIFDGRGKSIAQTALDAGSEGLHRVHTFLTNESASGVLDKATKIGLSAGPGRGVRRHPFLTGSREGGHDSREDWIVRRDDEVTIGARGTAVGGNIPVARAPRQSHLTSASNTIIMQESGGKDRLADRNDGNSKEKGIREKREVRIIQHLAGR